MSTAQCDPEFFMIANEIADAVTLPSPRRLTMSSTPCVVTDLKVAKKVEGKVGGKDVQAGMQNINYIMEQGDGQGNVINKGYDIGFIANKTGPLVGHKHQTALKNLCFCWPKV